jgi:signal transduction histidine kinase
MSYPGMTPQAGRPGGTPAPTLKSVRSLVHVLIGRDAAPAWRSAATRRAAYAAAWLGWALLAAAALAAVALGTWHHGTQPPGPGAHDWPGAVGWLAVEFAVSAALPLSPRYPLLAWRIAYLGVLVTPLIPGQNRVDTGYYVVATIVFAVAGLRYEQPRLWWMAALMLLPGWLWTGPDWAYPTRDTIALALLTIVLYAVGNWRRDRRKLAVQAEQTRRQRERNAVLEDRARIAREMHDVVAHHMSMIAVQAETAPYRLAGVGVPEPVAAEFAALSGAAREALTEMRRLLGVLRSDGGEAERVPQPRLDDVPGLVESARRAGALISLEMPRDTADIPPGVGLTAYRIVQESLSNAGRHAPGARISVVVAQEPRYVQLTIKNGPPATGQPRADGTGHGLAGMRERVALLGGELAAGPEADGGFAVRAVLPAAAPPPPAAAPPPPAAAPPPPAAAPPPAAEPQQAGGKR